MDIKETKVSVKETITFPVAYDDKLQIIRDSKGLMVCDIKGWKKMQEITVEGQDIIGEKVAKLLNECDAEKSICLKF